jgi:hypothetical protein
MPLFIIAQAEPEEEDDHGTIKSKLKKVTQTRIFAFFTKSFNVKHSSLLKTTAATLLTSVGNSTRQNE